MIINEYLSQIANDLILSETEKTKIDKSVKALKTHLSNYFDDIDKIIVFGSYSKNTNLPRKFHDNSDVDILVVFKSKLTIETYFKNLKAFGNEYYPNSYVKKRHPSVVLELQHILYDLIPSYYGGFIFENYKIPNSKKAIIEWTDANIGDIDKFNNKCKSNEYFIDVIRLFKLFNFNNGYYYDSFEIEEALLDVNFDDCKKLVEYFFHAVEYIDLEETPTFRKLRSFSDKLLNIKEIEKNREKIKDVIEEKFMVQ